MTVNDCVYDDAQLQLTKLNRGRCFRKREKRSRFTVLKRAGTPRNSRRETSSR